MPSRPKPPRKRAGAASGRREKPKPKTKAGAKPSKPRPAAARKTPSKGSSGSFPEALASLLRSRKISVPKGLLDAPPEAYASQPASFAEQLAQLPDAELRRFADKIAGHTQRQAERARREWETSPLIAELRRRKLSEPPAPARPVGVSASLSKPLKAWSDKEILKAARDWSKLGAR